MPGLAFPKAAHSCGNVQNRAIVGHPINAAPLAGCSNVLNLFRQRLAGQEPASTQLGNRIRTVVIEAEIPTAHRYYDAATTVQG